LTAIQTTSCAVAFSPDGSKIVSGSSDKTIRVWDADTLQDIGEPIVGHTDFVMSVAFFRPTGADRLGSWTDDPRLGSTPAKA